MDDRVYLIVDRTSGNVLAECETLASAQTVYMQFKSHALHANSDLMVTSRAKDAAAGNGAPRAASGSA